MNVTVVGAHDRQLEELLQASGVRVTSLKVEDLTALAQPAALQPAVVLLDVREHEALPAAVGMLRRHHPETGVVIVAAALVPSLMLDAMRAGVTEFLAFPLTASDLQAALSRLTESSVSTATGQVFAFLGAKGGVGTTTVAVNVATTMAQMEEGSALLIDLHLSFGDAAVFVGTEPRFSVVDALESVHRLDRTFLSGLVAHTRGGLDLLASSDRATTTPVDSGSVRLLLEAAARHYAFVVLDVPRYDPVMVDVLDLASRIVIVANQELATVRAATRVAAALRQRYGRDRVTVVVSRFDRHADIAPEDVARVLGSPVAQTFPSNYRQALEALNTGRPLVLDNHNKLAAALSGFAHNLVEPDDEPMKRRAPGLLGRLSGAARSLRH
jgi:pilus assembly protein CpaE